MSNPTVHSRIGASSMYRWKECPGSVRLSDDIPNTSSIYAAQGTLAHEIASELLLGNQEKAYDILMEKVTTIEERNDMMGAVLQYVEIVEAINKKSPNTKMLVEHKFDLTEIHPNLFGTSDCIIFNPDEKKLYVIDYKHGAGMAVEVDDNDQLKYYGLGALMSSGFAANTIELIIVQPRCFHPSGEIDRRFSFPSVDIFDFIADLKKYAVATEQPNAPLKAGDHCHFCPVKSLPSDHPKSCPEINRTTRELMSASFTAVNPKDYSPEKLSETLDKLDILETWIKGIREFAYSEAAQGRCPPNYKLVQKRNQRRWRNEDDVKEMAEKLGREDFFDRSLKTVPAIEKIYGKKEFEKLMGSHVISESSGTTLVHVSDKCEAVTSNGASKFFEPVNQNSTNIFE